MGIFNPSNVWTYIANIFTADQTIKKTAPRLILFDSSQGVNLKYFRIINSGTLLNFSAMNDLGITILITPLSLDRSGNATVANDLIANGRVIAGPTIAGSSVGDVTANRGGTGALFLGDVNHYLYFDGTKYILQTSPLAVTSTISERGRSIPIGEWITFNPILTPSAGTITGGTIVGSYTLVGKTVLFRWDASAIVTSLACGTITVTIPFQAAAFSGNAIDITFALFIANYETAIVSLLSSGVAMTLFRAGGAAFPAGTIYLRGEISYPIP